MDYEKLCREVIELSKSVGHFIKGEQLKLKNHMIEVKSVNSLVTYVDKTAEKNIVDRLAKLLPEAGFIAEEGTSQKKGDIYDWIIDPLDGTTNFIHGIPVYSVSIALKKGDKIVMGVVYEINMGECFYAWKDSPAYMNDTTINVTDNINIADSLLATGFPYCDLKEMDDYFKLFYDMITSCRSLRRLGSAAVDLAYVACGRFDAFYEYKLNAWDLAAGAFIVQRAGGKISDFKGDDDYLFGGQILASNQGVYDEMMKKIGQYY